MPSKSADDDVDRLYGLPLGAFVAARNELARRLRTEGRGAEAEQVAALQKPAIAAWAVNQLARRERQEIDLILDAGHRLRAAHKERNADKARQAIDSAREAERDAIRRLVSSAERLLAEEHGSATRGTLDRVAATLRAAAVTEEGRELLARGQLSEELSTTGFDLVATLVPATGRAKSASRERERRGADMAEARAALKEAKAREREAERHLRDAEKEVAAAEARLEEARAAAEEAAKEAADAEDALERAQRRRR